MSVVGHEPPPFFKRGPAPLARLSFFLAVSLTLLVVDLRYQTLNWVRVGVSTVIYPLQRLGYGPVQLLNQAGGYFASLATLQQENRELRARQLATANLLLRQEHLELENQRLRALLDMRARQPVAGRVADVLFAARDPFSRRVIVDKGLQQGVAAGEVVVDELGVIGQVTRAYPLTSEVTLITDKGQEVPVEVLRNGLRAVLAGAGAGGLQLRFLPTNVDVQVGDTLVTSGLDGIYLPGLPVAKVARVDRDNAFIFARIACLPIAGVERHGQVLVLAPRQLPPMPAPTPPAESPKAPVKAKRPRH